MNKRQTIPLHAETCQILKKSSQLLSAPSHTPYSKSTLASLCRLILCAALTLSICNFQGCINTRTDGGDTCSFPLKWDCTWWLPLPSVPVWCYLSLFCPCFPHITDWSHWGEHICINWQLGLVDWLLVRCSGVPAANINTFHKKINKTRHSTTATCVHK